MREKIKILIVDDDRAAMKYIEFIINSLGYTAFAASNREDSLQIIEFHKPDVILLDIMLGDSNGFDVCSEIKAKPEYGNPLIVMYSGVDFSAEDRERGLKVGIDGYLNKRASKEEIKLTIELYARLRQSEVSLLNSETELHESIRLVKHFNSILKVIRSVNQLILKVQDRDKLIMSVCSQLTVKDGYSSASISLISVSGKIELSVKSGYESGYSRYSEDDELKKLPGCISQVLSSGEVMILDEIESGCSDFPLCGHQKGSSVLLVRISHGESNYGVLSVSLPTILLDLEEEQNMLRTVASDLGSALFKIYTAHQIDRLTNIVKTISQPFAMISDDYRYIAVNDIYSEMFNLPIEQIIGKKIDELFGEENFNDVLKKRLDRSLAGETVQFEFEINFGARGLRWMLFEYHPYKNPEDGHWCIISHSLDITERKKAEEALYQTFLKLEKANSQLRSRTEWMDALTAFSLDIARKLDYDSAVNIILSHLHQKFRYTVSFTLLFNSDRTAFDIGNMDCGIPDFLEGIEVDYQKKFRILNSEESILLTNRKSAFSKIIDSVDESELGPEFNNLLKSFSGKGLISFIMLPILQGEKHIGQLFMGFNKKIHLSKDEKYFLTGLADYTAMLMENLRLYKKLKQSYDHLKSAQESMRKHERLKAMGEIASGVTHDINNTLAPITLYTEALLDREPDLSDRARRYLGTIQNAVTDIENVTHRLRSFYKQEDEMITAPIIIAELFNELIDLTRPRWETMPNRKGFVINIETEIDEADFEIVGIRSDIRESLVNCIFNAVDAMPDGGELRLRQEKTDGFCIISVADNGLGMTEEAVQHCQEPFYTTKGVAGTGLGLSGVYGMIQRHKGRLEISSRLGEGTEIQLFFPLTPEERTYEADEKILTPVPPMRILCIDDDRKLLDVLSEMLTIDGHFVESSTNGRDALVLFQEFYDRNDGFDLVITDLGMPGMDGYEVAGNIKKIDPAIAVILLTAWGSQILRKDEIPDDINIVLSKPPKMKAIQSALNSLPAKEN